jgi:hypothetical protein
MGFNSGFKGLNYDILTLSWNWKFTEYILIYEILMWAAFKVDIIDIL